MDRLHTDGNFLSDNDIIVEATWKDSDGDHCRIISTWVRGHSTLSLQRLVTGHWVNAHLQYCLLVMLELVPEVDKVRVFPST